jgi:hypothetical protein
LIDRIKELEIIHKYKNLLRVFKHQQLNHWLLNWEKMYAKTIRLNIFDVQKIDVCTISWMRWELLMWHSSSIKKQY